MVVGDKIRFWIPAELADGNTPSRPGAPTGTLVFDIALLAIFPLEAGIALHRGVLVLAFVGVSGSAVARGEEFSLRGLKDSAKQGKVTVALTQVTLEQSDAGAAVNLSLVVTAAAGKPESLALTVPATSPSGEVAWSGGTLALKRVEGLDRYFHTAPAKVVWWFELSPPRAHNAGEPASSHLYFIDDRPVSAVVFRKFLSTLHGQKHWRCAETEGGGITRWEAKDAKGRRYQVEEGGGDVNRSSIRRLP